MEMLNRLVDKGNTVLIIEHNLDVIKLVDYVIDIGPEGGKGGGKLVGEGTPESLAIQKNSHTATYLAIELTPKHNTCQLINIHKKIGVQSKQMTLGLYSRS